MRCYAPAVAAFLAWTGTFPAFAAEEACTVRFYQDDNEILPVAVGIWQAVTLRKAAFHLSITPASCAYLIATLADSPSIAEVERFTPLVFAGTGNAVAASPEDADILHWPSRTPIRTTLSEQTQDWRVLDAFKQETTMLGYEPQVVQAWGSAFPLQSADDRVTANFKRLTPSVRLDGRMPNIDLPGIVYLKRKELLKPSWHGAFAPWLLLEPYRVLYLFR